ncbi:hypothetical protein FPY71_17140 [Aureimonas fodinaquatilis]|uniref:Uncharacterized protein n=1 Tax=Aureimonas fodinaquatilis TaxID=2565783 RepID=A0A5B0DRH9_9HYPH|nr:hypothetical protein [Aureimonas fodinaquatilis]KAA0968602.1 hypothetical protein FPY71_17140 [Aureimonas fodinaquatilis]
MMLHFSSSVLALAMFTTSAMAQAPAPREVPDGFVVPGPAPTGAPAPRAVPDGFVVPGPAPTGQPTRAAPANPAIAAPAHHGSTDWPCVQRRVERIDAGQIWPDFPADGGQQERSAQTRALVQQVAQRRVPLAEGEKQLRDYIASLPESQRESSAQTLFSELLSTFNRERADVVQGIVRYASKQKGLASRIREETGKLDQLMSQPQPDLKELEAQQEALLWQTRVFDERRLSLTYVCEVPILIEQRMFAFGRTLRDSL